MADGNVRTGTTAAIALVAAQIAPLPLPAIGLASAAAQYGARPVRVSCYSDGNRSNSCNLPANTQSVTFVGPDRSNRCREGETWGRRGNQLVVSNGCGGVFEAMVYQGGGNGGGWGGGNDSGFAGEISCRSRGNRPEQCYAQTQNRVEMLQQYSQAPCIEGRSWSYNRNNIQVRNGCQARFGYGYGNWNGGGNNGGGWGGGGGPGGGWGGSGFASETECRSQNNRYERCSANTQGRVEMLRQYSSTTCVQGRNWGYDNRSIWVDNGCQARFGYGYGNVQGDTGGNGGSNTGAVIGGVALAAGLIALLAAASNNKSKSAGTATSATGPATLEADLSRFPSDARAEAQACLDEAARQIGATGGSRVRLDQVDSVQRSGDGWMILAKLTGSYDGRVQAMTMDCRATGSKVTAFDVR